MARPSSPRGPISFKSSKPAPSDEARPILFDKVLDPLYYPHTIPSGRSAKLVLLDADPFISPLPKRLSLHAKISGLILTPAPGPATMQLKQVTETSRTESHVTDRMINQQRLMKNCLVPPDKVMASAFPFAWPNVAVLCSLHIGWQEGGNSKAVGILRAMARLAPVRVFVKGPPPASSGKRPISQALQIVLDNASNIVVLPRLGPPKVSEATSMLKSSINNSDLIFTTE